ANERVLDRLEEAGMIESRAGQLLMHVVAAESRWLARVRGEPEELDFWPDPSPELCRQVCDAAGAGWRRYVELHGLDKPVDYETSKGVPYRHSVREILMQVVAHGEHHRGQIALILRDGGHAPVNTDYITFLRERQK
ncbi:MAG: DUF664 domain-containing protein, partial [Gammaproteobacteria bacterium]|nr:DUF664 domain-containing protein [Gemmatimonadota bacterium]NIU72773.1 DUF664 domain-containing protein [Gammaproteobacteria bacterium]